MKICQNMHKLAYSDLHTHTHTHTHTHAHRKELELAIKNKLSPLT